MADVATDPLPRMFGAMQVDDPTLGVALGQDAGRIPGGYVFSRGALLTPAPIEPLPLSWYVDRDLPVVVPFAFVAGTKYGLPWRGRGRRGEPLILGELPQ